jgi:thymidylate kinase
MDYKKNNNKKIIPLKGKLIVVEGIDGSGKSTQLRLLEKWLISRNIPVFFTEWNSSETVKQITKKGKKSGRLTQSPSRYYMLLILLIDMKEIFCRSYMLAILSWLSLCLYCLCKRHS